MEFVECRPSPQARPPAFALAKPVPPVRSQRCRPNPPERNTNATPRRSDAAGLAAANSAPKEPAPPQQGPPQCPPSPHKVSALPVPSRSLHQRSSCTCCHARTTASRSRSAPARTHIALMKTAFHATPPVHPMGPTEGTDHKNYRHAWDNPTRVPPSCNSPKPAGSPNTSSEQRFCGRRHPFECLTIRSIAAGQPSLMPVGPAGPAEQLGSNPAQRLMVMGAQKLSNIDMFDMSHFEAGAGRCSVTWEREWRIRADRLEFSPGDATIVFPNRDFVSLAFQHFPRDDDGAMPWHFVALEDLGVKIQLDDDQPTNSGRIIIIKFPSFWSLQRNEPHFVLLRSACVAPKTARPTRPPPLLPRARHRQEPG